MKDSGIAFTDIRSREDAKEYLFSSQVIEKTRELYVNQNLSVRQTMEEMALSQWHEGNVGYFARTFSYHLPKEGKGRGKGRGGARPNAGRPVGTKTCLGCGHLRGSCTCPEPPGEDDFYTLLSVVTEPVQDKTGVYSAIVAIESSKGRYKVYEKQIERYPTYADIQRTMAGGRKVPPERAKAYFGQQLKQQLEH